MGQISHMPRDRLQLTFSIDGESAVTDGRGGHPP